MSLVKTLKTDFQVFTFNDTDSIHRWMKHIQGAAKLLEWRGEEQLHNPQGLHLFRLMRSQVVSLHRPLHV